MREKKTKHQSVATPHGGKDDLNRWLASLFFLTQKLEKSLGRKRRSVGNWKMVFWLPRKIWGKREREKMFHLASFLKLSAEALRGERISISFLWPRPCVTCPITFFSLSFSLSVAYFFPLPLSSFYVFLSLFLILSFHSLSKIMFKGQEPSVLRRSGKKAICQRFIFHVARKTLFSPHNSFSMNKLFFLSFPTTEKEK